MKTDSTANPAAIAAPFARILVAIDRSAPSAWALQLASRLAAATGATLLPVHVADTRIATPSEVAYVQSGILDELVHDGEDLLDRVRQQVPTALAIETHLCQGVPSTEISEQAKRWSVDLIVMGAHSHSRLAEFLLGSTAEKVVRDAPCPVMTVRHPPVESAATASRAAAVTLGPERR